MRFGGPTARAIPAWGNAPGKEDSAIPRANGLGNTSLGQRPRGAIIMRFGGPTARPILQSHTYRSSYSTPYFLRNAKYSS